MHRALLPVISCWEFHRKGYNNVTRTVSLEMTSATCVTYFNDVTTNFSSNVCVYKNTVLAGELAAVMTRLDPNDYIGYGMYASAYFIYLFIFGGAPLPPDGPPPLTWSPCPLVFTNILLQVM